MDADVTTIRRNEEKDGAQRLVSAASSLPEIGERGVRSWSICTPHRVRRPYAENCRIVPVFSQASRVNPPLVSQIDWTF
jgi:hypothetical protein